MKLIDVGITEKIHLATSWLDREVINPNTGNKIKVRSLPTEEREKYRPKTEHSFSHPVNRQTMSFIPQGLSHEIIEHHPTHPTVKFRGSKKDIEKALRTIEPNSPIAVKNHATNTSSFYDPEKRKII